MSIKSNASSPRQFGMHPNPTYSFDRPPTQYQQPIGYLSPSFVPQYFMMLRIT